MQTIIRTDCLSLLTDGEKYGELVIFLSHLPISKLRNSSDQPEWSQLLHAVIREAQRLGLSVPNTDLVVYIDIGDSLHFGNKQEAGRRLALPARAKVYGESNLVYSGPLFIEKFIDGSKIHCRFIHTGGGLQAKSGELKGFAIAGSDKNFVLANAVIHNDTVTVYSQSVPNPVHVRYAYAGNPIGNLINKEGLPASPFTTEGKQLQLPDTLATSVSSGEGTISPSGGIICPNTVTVRKCCNRVYL